MTTGGGDSQIDFIGSGWAFPLRVNSRGGLELSSGERDIEESIRIILSTPIGERRMRPNFGCGIHDLVFTALDSTSLQLIRSAVQEALRRCEIDITQIKCLIPHQANRRIIDAVADRLGATPEQVFVNLHKYGNTSAASVAIALDEAVSSGKFQRGDLILLLVFGAGLTWGAAVIEW